MADEPQQTAQTAPETAPETNAPQAELQQTAPQATAQTGQPGLLTYVVRHHLMHDGQEYHPGETFQHPDTAVTAALRKAKAIALQTEVMAAEDVAAQLAAKDAEAAQLRAELARLRAEREQVVSQTPAQSNQSTSGGKGSK